MVLAAGEAGAAGADASCARALPVTKIARAAASDVARNGERILPIVLFLLLLDLA
jgi:hypothetical protein